MNVDPSTQELIRNILIFLGTVLTVGGVVFAAIWSRRSKRDRAPVDERDDMKAQFEAMAIANKTVVETMIATNQANDRIFKTLTEDKTKLDLQISEMTGQLRQREADINRMYEQREKHIDEIERLKNEAVELRDTISVATRRRDFLEEELKAALQRLDQLKPESLQDEIAKQRKSHHSNTAEIATTEGGPTP